MKIAFWSPVHGQTATTSNMSAISTYMSLKYTYSNLIMRNHFVKSTLEKHFLDSDYIKSLNLTDTGVDALYRQMMNKTISSDMVSNYTTMLLRRRLDLLIGTYGTNKEIYNKNFLQTYEELFNLTDKAYDFTFIDVNSGIENKLSEKILLSADLIVINLNQNINVLDELFSNENYRKLYNKAGNKIFFVVGMYDKYSKLNISNIRRIHDIKKEKITFIPYNRQFADYTNEGKVIEFIINNMNSNKKDDTCLFIKQLDDCIKKIFNLLEINGELRSIE